MAKRSATIKITVEDIKRLNEARRYSNLALEDFYAQIGKRVLDAAGASFEPTVIETKEGTITRTAPDALWSLLRNVTVKPEIV